MDEDEDEDGDKRQENDLAANSLLQGEVAQTPVQLSNALMKALNVGGGERAEPTPPQPKNSDNKSKTW